LRWLSAAIASARSPKSPAVMMRVGSAGSGSDGTTRGRPSLNVVTGMRSSTHLFWSRSTEPRFSIASSGVAFFYICPRARLCEPISHRYPVSGVSHCRSTPSRSTSVSLSWGSVRKSFSRYETWSPYAVGESASSAVRRSTVAVWSLATHKQGPDPTTAETLPAMSSAGDRHDSGPSENCNVIVDPARTAMGVCATLTTSVMGI